MNSQLTFSSDLNHSNYRGQVVNTKLLPWTKNILFCDRTNELFGIFNNEPEPELELLIRTRTRTRTRTFGFGACLVARKVARYFSRNQRYIYSWKTMSMKITIEWADGYVAVQIEDITRDNLIIRPMSYRLPISLWKRKITDEYLTEKNRNDRLVENISHCTPISLPITVGNCGEANKIVENKIQLSIFYPLKSFIMKSFCLQKCLKCSPTIDFDMLNIFGIRIIMKYCQDFRISCIVKVPTKMATIIDLRQWRQRNDWFTSFGINQLIIFF